MKEVIISFDMSTFNTGYTIYENGSYSFGEFSSLKPKILKSGKPSKAKSGGTFDIKIFFNELYKIKKKYKDYNITVCYATFVTNTNFSINGTLYKLVGVLELVFGKSNIIELNEGSARKHCGINTIVAKRVKETVENQMGYKLLSTPGKKEASKVRRKYYKEEAINYFNKENPNYNNISDDIADSFVMIKFYIEKEKEEIF